MTMRRHVGILGAALLSCVCTARLYSAQEQGAGPSTSESDSAKHKSSSQTYARPEVNAVAKTSEGTQMGLLGRFMDDQHSIWTSPAKLRFSETEWLVRISGVSAAIFVTYRDFSKHLSQNPTTVRHYKTLSNAGVGALMGGAGGMWLLGHVSHNEHWSETGFLAGEAALNSFVAVESFKYALRRERPYQGNGSGAFFQNGGTSFPSEHAAAAWSIAGVISPQHRSPFEKVIGYGLASLLTVSRRKAHQHFSSDVLFSQCIGDFVGKTTF